MLRAAQEWIKRLGRALDGNKDSALAKQFLPFWEERQTIWLIVTCLYGWGIIQGAAQPVLITC